MNKVYIVVEESVDHYDADNTFTQIHNVYSNKSDAQAEVKKLKAKWKKDYDQCCNDGCNPDEAPDVTFKIVTKTVK